MEFVLMCLRITPHKYVAHMTCLEILVENLII